MSAPGSTAAYECIARCKAVGREFEFAAVGGGHSAGWDLPGRWESLQKFETGPSIRAVPRA
jgi:hypothetical protein